MYVVSIRYPRRAGEPFDLAHYLDVHVPMGMRLFQSVNGYLPRRVFVQHSTCGVDANPESSDSYVTSWLCFDTSEQAAGFSRVFADSLASRMLIDDMRNFTPDTPTFAVGKLIEYDDVAAIAARGDSQGQVSRG